MFTGIIEGRGTVQARWREGEETRIRVSAPCGGALGRGQSIAVDGVCLTVVTGGADWFEAVVSPETLSRTTLGLRSNGDGVNLERPLRLGDPLGGHLVQGHVDGVGAVEAVQPEGSGKRMRIGFPSELRDLIVEKGSIAVDGVSLTVASRLERSFEVALIPETLTLTCLGEHQTGTPVNLEVDMLGRFVVEYLKGREPARPTLVTREHLARHGFGREDVGS